MSRPTQADGLAELIAKKLSSGVDYTYAYWCVECKRWWFSVGVREKGESSVLEWTCVSCDSDFGHVRLSDYIVPLVPE